MSFNSFSTGKKSEKPAVSADKPAATPAKPDVKPDAGSPAAK